MRVLLLNDGSTPAGGAELQTLRLRELLGDAGHEVRLLSSRAAPEGGTPKAEVVCAGTTHPKLRVAGQTYNPSAALALRRELHRFRPDVVHVRMMLTQLSPSVLPVLADVPAIWQIVYYKAICPRGTKLLPDGSRCEVRAGTVCLANRCVTPQSWLLDMGQQRLWRRWAHHLDAVVTLSDTMRRRLAESGVAEVGVIPNGVRERPMRPALRQPPTVIYAGRLAVEKGVDLLLHAFAHVLDRVPRARLLVAGDGPQRAELEHLRTRLGLDASVRFLGHLDREDVERHADDAWVQAVPGRWEEPLGNVTLEAMMRGSVPVVTNLGGPAEVVDHDETGTIVAADSPEELAAGITALLTDADHCEAMARRARAVAMDRFAERRVVARFEALYDEVRTHYPSADRTGKGTIT